MKNWSVFKGFHCVYPCPYSPSASLVLPSSTWSSLRMSEAAASGEEDRRSTVSPGSSSIRIVDRHTFHIEIFFSKAPSHIVQEMLLFPRGLRDWKRFERFSGSCLPKYGTSGRRRTAEEEAERSLAKLVARALLLDPFYIFLIAEAS